MSDEHEPFIKTPKQLIAVVVLSFVIPIALIIMLVNYVGTSKRDGAGSDALSSEAIAHRISPVARFELVDASGPKVLADGQAVYDTQCAACHAAGVAGAPKFGDASAWEARLGSGYDALLGSALKGKGAMAPQGGGKYSDLEIGRAVVFMANEAGADFAEPAEEAPAAEAPAAEAPAAEATADTTAPAEPVAATEAPAAVAAASAEVATTSENVKEAVEQTVDKAADAVKSAAGAAGAAVAAATTTAAEAVKGAADKATAAVAAATGATSHDLAAGEKIYNGICMGCHAAGIAGAPKAGDKAAWAGREEKGVEELTKTVVSGKGAMPPRGGTQHTDEELANGVAFMLSQLK